jgi:hypothetical protein
VGLAKRGGRWRWRDRYSVYLLYWYKSTNTDAEGAARKRMRKKKLDILIPKFRWFSTSISGIFAGGGEEKRERTCRITYADVC